MEDEAAPAAVPATYGEEVPRSPIQRHRTLAVAGATVAAMAAIVAGFPPNALQGEAGGSTPAVPEPPAQRAGVTAHQYTDQTSLSEVPGRLVTPVAAVGPTGRPLPDSARIVRALRSRDGRTVTFTAPTVVDFGHLVAGVYTRPGATADPVSAFPDFFRTANPGETGRLTLADGDWYVARFIELPPNVPIDVVGFRFTSGPPMHRPRSPSPAAGCPASSWPRTGRSPRSGTQPLRPCSSR